MEYTPSFVVPSIDGTVGFLRFNKGKVRNEPGVYLIHDLRGVIYVGKASSIRKRFEDHTERQVNPDLLHAMINPIGEQMFSWIHCEREDLEDLEAKLIRAFNPLANRIKYQTK